MNIKKIGCHGNVLERSQLNFMAIVYARKATSPENFAKVGRTLSKIIRLAPILKRQAVSAVRGHVTINAPHAAEL